jgi:transcriptional regulator with XRE-family HTH domain
LAEDPHLAGGSVRDEQGFGQRLRQVRVHAGLSQSALEVRSGIPKARLSRYENGHVLPSIETLARLASALEVSEASLLGDQRAVLEEFFNVLFQRGIRVYSAEQSVRLANALADIIDAVSPRSETPSAGAVQPVASATLTPVHGLLESGGVPAEPVPPA